MNYKPCYGCHLREGCAVKAEWQAKLRKLGLRSADWKCEPKLKSIVMGSVVKIRWTTYDEYGTDYVIIRGIVMRWKDERRLWVYIAPGQCGQIKSPVVPLLPSQLTFTDERVPVCRYCGRPKDVEIKMKLKHADPPEYADWHCRDDYNDNGEWGKEYYELDCVFTGPEASAS